MLITKQNCPSLALRYKHALLYIVFKLQFSIFQQNLSISSVFRKKQLKEKIKKIKAYKRRCGRISE